MEFKDQYKHPKWQKRRLDYMEYVLQKENTGYNDDECKYETPPCEWCSTTEVSLHVHHLQYKRDHKVWEYENEDLILLCEDCHKLIHEMKSELDILIKSIFKKWYYNAEYAFNIMSILELMDSRQSAILNRLAEDSFLLTGGESIKIHFDRMYKSHERGIPSTDF